MQRARPSDLFAIDISSNLQNFQPRRRPESKGVADFSPSPQQSTTIILVIIPCYYSYYIIPSIRTRSRCFQGKLDPPFGVEDLCAYQLDIYFALSYGVLCDIIILTLNGVDKL